MYFEICCVMYSIGAMGESNMSCQERRQKLQQAEDMVGMILLQRVQYIGGGE